jgi:hypothetical protein
MPSFLLYSYKKIMMNSLELKNNFHTVIDNTSNTHLLSLVYNLFKKNLREK